MDNYKGNFSGTIEPRIGKDILTDYNDRKAIKIDDFKTNSDYSFEGAVSFMNDRLSGTNNIAALFDKCTGAAASFPSKSVDPPSERIAVDYCIQFGTLPTTNWNGARWLPSTTALNEVERKKDDFRLNQDTYVSKMGTFINEYTSNLYSPETTYMSGPSGLKSAYDSLQTVKDQTTSTIAFLSKFSNDLFKALNCQILGRHVRTFEVALCAKFTYKLMYQTDALIALGLILFFHSWCVCCGIRCAPKRDEKSQTKPGAVLPATQEVPQGQINPQQAGGQPQFQNAGQKYL
jgi:hypothetical protein